MPPVTFAISRILHGSSNCITYFRASGIFQNKRIFRRISLSSFLASFWITFLETWISHPNERSQTGLDRPGGGGVCVQHFYLYGWPIHQYTNSCMWCPWLPSGGSQGHFWMTVCLLHWNFPRGAYEVETWRITPRRRSSQQGLVLSPKFQPR